VIYRTLEKLAAAFRKGGRRLFMRLDPAAAICVAREIQ
jgi:hypothetical protein